MIETEKFDKFEVSSPHELRSWLMGHHAQAASVWLVTYKKHIPTKYLSTSEILDELLCFGWIDGVRRKLDDEKTMQLISPRKVEHWAVTYKARAERLLMEGRMHEAGLRSIEAAKQNGKWVLMSDVDALEIPSDLYASLNASFPALEYFNTSAPSYRRNVLRWLKLAKTNATREKRLQKICEFSSGGKRILQM
jgi:uncharacterized protein YdeI (YjbR/CyaY-like superfamily)